MPWPGFWCPCEGETTSIFSRAVNDRRGIRLVIAIIPVLVVVQIVTSALHVGYLGSFTWPLFLAAGAVLLIRRNASEKERVWINTDLVPMLHAGSQPHHRRSTVVRVALGVLLGTVGVVFLIVGHPTSAALRPVGGALLVIAAIVVVFGPWWLRLVRDLMSERQARALAEERAQMAAHVHDSVLQTLGPHPALGRRPAARGAPRPRPGARAAFVAVRGPAARAASARTPRRWPRASACSSARSRPITASPCRWWWWATAR